MGNILTFKKNKNHKEHKEHNKLNQNDDDKLIDDNEIIKVDIFYKNGKKLIFKYPESQKWIDLIKNSIVDSIDDSF